MNVHYQQILLVVLILLPNLLYLKYPPKNTPNKKIKKKVFWVIMCEKLGQVGVFTLPAFYHIKLDNNLKFISLLIMILSLTLYYLCWFRYVNHNSNYIYLYKSIYKIPIPLAIMPIIYFLFLGVILNSLPLIIITVIFAIGHILETLRTKGEETW